MIEIVSNFFKQDEIFHINDYVKKTKNHFTWKSSFSWDDNIKWGVEARTLLTIAPGFVRQRIIKHFNFKDDDNLFVGIYLWFPGANIAWHNDTQYDYGGTIYLNERWHANHGGLFLYSDGFDKEQQKPVGEIKGFVPEYNTMIVNKDNNGHAVTTTTVSAPIRKTIQFFHRK